LCATVLAFMENHSVESGLATHTFREVEESVDQRSPLGRKSAYESGFVICLLPSF